MVGAVAAMVEAVTVAAVLFGEVVEADSVVVKLVVMDAMGKMAEVVDRIL